MIPINNSDLAWLVVSDYNQDHNIPFAEELREDINDPEIDQWHQQNDQAFMNISRQSRLQAGSGFAGSRLGINIGGQRPIGRYCLVDSVGGHYERTPDNVGGVQYGSLVGGHYDTH